MGGNVIFNMSGESIKGGKIHSYDITDTLPLISQITNIPVNKLHNNILGSGYKTDVSGDIDIAVDNKEIGYEELRDYLKTSYDWVNANDGLKIINILVPIQGNQSKKILSSEDYNGYVQVDLMFGSPEWMKFSYYSHGKKSKYKGFYRTSLLMCVALLKTEFLDKDEQDEVIGKIGAVFDLNNGLVMQRRMRRAKPSGYKKQMQRVDLNDKEWNERYGNIEIKNLDITNPNEAAEFLFGKGTKAKDLQSFEQVVALVAQLPKFEQYQINKLFHKRTGYFIDEVPYA